MKTRMLFALALASCVCLVNCVGATGYRTRVSLGTGHAVAFGHAHQVRVAVAPVYAAPIVATPVVQAPIVQTPIVQAPTVQAAPCSAPVVSAPAVSAAVTSPAVASAVCGSDPVVSVATGGYAFGGVYQSPAVVAAPVVVSHRVRAVNVGVAHGGVVRGTGRVVRGTSRVLVGPRTGVSVSAPGVRVRVR